MAGLATCIMLVNGPTRAEEAAPHAQSTPDALYEAGKTKLKSGDAKGALTDFKVALQGAEHAADLGLTWQLLIAVAVTYREADEPGFAMEYYRRFLDSTELHQDALTAKWRKRRGLAERDIGELERAANGTHGFVTVASTPPGAAISIGGVPAGADGDRITPFGLYLKPGDHVVTVALTGYEPAEQPVTVAAGKLRPLAFVLAPVTLEVTPSEHTKTSGPSAMPSADAVLSSGDGEDTFGAIGPWAVLGTAGATLITAITLTAVSEADYADLNSPSEKPASGTATEETIAAWNDKRSQADSMQIASLVLYGLSAAAITGGVLWLLLDGDEDTVAATATPSLHVIPTGTGVMTGASWRF